MSRVQSIQALPLRELRRGEPGYPAALHRALDAPERLFCVGALDAQVRCVAIVGARAASGHGMAAAKSLASELAEAGFAVVSGGAIGIDAAAHRGALDAGGRTISVLATGVDVAYPARHRPLFDEILASGRGALVSPFALGAPVRKWRCVRRNRIIAGLADAVIVVEAGLASGAIYTAQAACAYDRVLGAHPGAPGCDALIAGGAAVAESAADVVAALAGTPRRPHVAVPEPQSEEGVVLAALDHESARDENELAAATGLAARAVSRALMGLALEGLAVALPGRSFVRSSLAEDLMVG